MHKRKHNFGKYEMKEFLQQGLDNPNQLEAAYENRFYARRLFSPFPPSNLRSPARIELICPTTAGQGRGD
jgi:hypothetical protein